MAESSENPATEDIPYLERRAEEELELAQRAEHPRAVKAHYQLADHYLDLIHGRHGAGKRSE